MNPRHAPTAAGPELPRRRDDDGSPFAREQFALRPPEEQDAMIAKWKMQQLTAEQLDLQLRERKRQRRQALRRERLAAARAAPPAASADGAPVVRRHRAARPPPSESTEVTESEPPQQPIPAGSDREEAVLWWHEPDARRSPPQPRRRSGRELLTDPQELALRDEQRLKKLEAGAALRQQMQ